MLQFNKTIIREPTACALLKSQYWHQLKYFVIELFGCVAAYCSLLLVCVSCTVQSEIQSGLNNVQPHDQTMVMVYCRQENTNCLVVL
jgi:hypothetical protein